MSLASPEKPVTHEQVRKFYALFHRSGLFVGTFSADNDQLPQLSQSGSLGPNGTAYFASEITNENGQLNFLNSKTSETKYEDFDGQLGVRIVNIAIPEGELCLEAIADRLRGAN